MESQRFSPTPICPICVHLVAGRPNTRYGRCGLIVCQEEEADCGRWLDILLCDSNEPEFGYHDMYYYCHICVPRAKHEEITYYPDVPSM